MSAQKSFQIWIDGDACPQTVKAILYKTAERLKIKMTVVANSAMRVPASSFIETIAVRHGPDEADRKIIELMNAGDIVVTQDIPLAALVVEKGGIAIGPRGELFDDHRVQSRLANRNLSEQLRSAGIETGGPKPHSSRDTQAFANQLDRLLTKTLKSRDE